MRNPLEEIEETFMTEVELLSLDERALDVILPEYARLESETVERLRQVGGESVVVALQRRIAAARLSAARQKNASMEVAAELFKQSNELGYDTPEEKLVSTAIFARICLKNRFPDLALLELGEALRNSNVPEREHAAFQDLLAQLRR